MPDRGDSTSQNDPDITWPPDPEHVVAAAAGDQQVLAGILFFAFPRAAAFGRALGLGPADAEDLAGDVCERVVKGLSGLRDPARFEAWFWSIARNRVRTALRRRRRHQETFERAGVGIGDPEHLAIVSDEQRIVAAAFASLRLRDRQILWLREVQGLGDEEVGEALGMRPGAVRVAAMRARRRLEEAYDALGGNPSDD